jgi:hypothetical protein
MRTTILLPLAAFAASCTVGDEGPAATSAVENATYGAADEEALAGRTAGEPRNCVRQQDVRNTRSLGGNTILFDGPGGVIYVNKATGSCPRIQPWHAISHRTINSSICSGELIRVFDPQTGVEYGGCSLGEFVPWRRTD